MEPDSTIDDCLLYILEAPFPSSHFRIFDPLPSSSQGFSSLYTLLLLFKLYRKNGEVREQIRLENISRRVWVDGLRKGREKRNYRKGKREGRYRVIIFSLCLSVACNKIREQVYRLTCKNTSSLIYIYTIMQIYIHTRTNICIHIFIHSFIFKKNRRR